MMDNLSGILLIPPDRGHILSKPVWKTRYVVIGKRSSAKKDRQNSTISLGGRVNSSSDLKPLTQVLTDDYCISVFRHKGDTEPVHQWPINCVADCQVEMVAYRKQEPILPTLIITLSDKERKRRSTRAAGLISNKESGASTLWFRAPPDDHQINLNQWAQFILSRKQPASSDGISPSMFTSPFTPRSRDATDQYPRPGSDSHIIRPDLRSLQHKSSSATYSTGRDFPATLGSDSPSLRSKRSDVSSPSSLNQYTTTKGTFTIDGQHYTTVFTTDAGFPSDGGFYQGDSQGLSSNAVLPGRGQDGAQQPMIPDVSAPPAPGETILDRAFQLGHIPGAEANIPGQEKFSSIARFDALMRELEEKRKQKEAKEPKEATKDGKDANVAKERAEKINPRSTFEIDDTSEDAESHSMDEDEDSDNDVNYADEQQHRIYTRGSLISPSARRALDFIASRHDERAKDYRSHRPTISRTHVSFHADPLSIRPQSPPTRPHTAHGKSRASQSNQTHSITPHQQPLPAIPIRQAEDSTRHPNGEKRQSGSSSKRLSFTEFTKRLSSTSSLLLNQTNSGRGSSNRASAEIVPHSATVALRSNMKSLVGGAAPPPRTRQREEQDKKCGWRGSISVIDEGGFP